MNPLLLPREATVLACETIAVDMARLVLRDETAFIAGPPTPGAFVNLQVPGAPHLLLRRPISLMAADASEKTLTLGIQLKGEGTRRICALRPGELLNLMGPMGNGFSAGNAKTVALVGGGLGVAPLVYAAMRFAHAKRTAYVGFRSKAFAYAEGELQAVGVDVLIATDDGSLGHRGLVTDLLKGGPLPELILACGPKPMLRAVQAFALEKNVPCQISLEERMACGVGACLVCNCKTRAGDGWTYRRVCKDGPVFSAEEVDFT